MAALSPEELSTAMRLVAQVLTDHASELTSMHEKIATLHSQIDSLEAAAAAALTREQGVKAQLADLQNELAVAKAVALNDDSLVALDHIANRIVGVMRNLASGA